MPFSEERIEQYKEEITNPDTSLDDIINILEEIVKGEDRNFLTMFGKEFKRIKDLSSKFPSRTAKFYSQFLNSGLRYYIYDADFNFKELREALLDQYLSQETEIRSEDMFLTIWMECYDTKSTHFNDKALEAAKKLKNSPSFKNLAKEENLNKLLIHRFLNFWQIAWVLFENHKEIFAESNYLNYMNNVKKCLEQGQNFEITKENLLFIFSDRYSVLDLMEKDLINVEELCRKLKKFGKKAPKTPMEQNFDHRMRYYTNTFSIFSVLNIPFLEKGEKLRLCKKIAEWNALDKRNVNDEDDKNLNEILKEKLAINESSEYFLDLSKDQAQERLEKELSKLFNFYNYNDEYLQELKEPFINKSLSVIQKISHRTNFEELFSEEVFEKLWIKHKALFWPVVKVMCKEYPSYFLKGKIKKYLKEVQECLKEKKIFEITSENIEFLVTDLDSNLAEEGLLDIVELRERFKNLDRSFKEELLEQGVSNRLLIISDVELVKDLVVQANLVSLGKLKAEMKPGEFQTEFDTHKNTLHENIARLFDQKTGETEKDIENKLGLKPKEIGKFDEVLNRSYFYEILYEILNKISFGYLHIPNKTETFNNMIDQLIDRSIDPNLAARTLGPPEGNYTQSRNRNNNTLRPR